MIDEDDEEPLVNVVITVEERYAELCFDEQKLFLLTGPSAIDEKDEPAKAELEGRLEIPRKPKKPAVPNGEANGKANGDQNGTNDAQVVVMGENKGVKRSHAGGDDAPPTKKAKLAEDDDDDVILVQDAGGAIVIMDD